MNNRPVPVKLLPAGSNRTKLLRDIGEKNIRFNQNDYIEKRAGEMVKAGKMGHSTITLLAIENASEVAKTYLHARGMFEKMMEDIIGTRENMTYQVRSSKNNLNIQRKSGVQENFILVEQKFGNGTGHYGLIHLKHRNGQVNVYDSMYDSDLSNFVNVAGKWAPQGRSWNSPKIRSILGCKAKDIEGWGVQTKKLQVQPTGGFVATNYNNFLNANHNGYGIRIKRQYGETVTKGAFRLQQYDEMSQHHFCYMESIYAMMLAVGLTNNPGPNDPRKRLAFIKKFIWGMIHKYTPKSKRRTAKWKYFSKTFPYIMATTSKSGNPLRMWKGVAQLPDNNGEFSTKLVSMSWKGYDKIDPSWSLEDVLAWVHTGRSPRGNRNANSNSNNNNNNNRNTKRPRNNNNGVNAKRVKTIPK
jgi:hypothetical protein